MIMAVISYLAICCHQGRRRPGFCLCLKSCMSISISSGICWTRVLPQHLSCWGFGTTDLSKILEENEKEKIRSISQQEENLIGREILCTQVPLIKIILYVFPPYSVKLGWNEGLALQNLPCLDQPCAPSNSPSGTAAPQGFAGKYYYILLP